VSVHNRNRLSWIWQDLRSPGTLFVLPAALLVLFIVACPVVQALWTSLTDKTVAGPPPRFVGFGNYIHWIHRADFWQTFKNTFLFATGTLALCLLLGFPLALSLNRLRRFRNLIGAVILLPWIVPTVISILVWAWMFNPNVGMINWVLQRMGLIQLPIAWLGLPTLAMVSIIIVSAWRRIPYFGVVLHSGISEIPQELYEAARIDGANAWQQFRYVTIPALRGVLFLVSTLAFIETAYDFALVYILTRGGPAGSTEILSVKAFITAFQTGQMGKGVAVPLMAFPIFAPAMLLVTRRMIARWAAASVT